MSELISGKEAKLAWANGETVQIQNTIVDEDFYDLTGDNAKLGVFDLDFYRFRLKPRTITINGIELPKPSFTCHSTSNSNIIEIGFKTEQEARDFHLQFRRAWK